MTGAGMRARRAVFLDKDGTLVEDVPHNVEPSRIRLAPGAETGVARLARAGFVLAVVSNQAGVARGLFDERALAVVESVLRERLTALGAELAGFYYCPHDTPPAPADGCGCRKPAPGLLFRAARELRVSLPASWLVGDILDDVEAGRRAGCRTVLLDNGHETVWQLDSKRVPHHIVSDLDEASRLIVGMTHRGAGNANGIGREVA